MRKLSKSTINKRKKYLEVLNKSITYYVICSIISTLVVIALVVFLTLKIINENIRHVYIDNNVMIDIEPKINKTLEKSSDLNSYSLTGNLINITNNSNKVKKYQILLSPTNDKDNNIRISIDDNYIRNLNQFNKEGENYLIYELNIEPTYTAINNIKVWLGQNSDVDKLKVDFKIIIKIIDE